MDNFRKALCGYFQILLEHRREWNTTVGAIERPVQALLNQTEQLLHVQRHEPENEFLLGVKEKLLVKIRNAIEEEMLMLNKVCTQLKSMNDKLRNKLSNIELCYEKLEGAAEINMEEFSKGCGSKPSMALMMEYAEDSWKYYNTLFININVNIKLVKYEKRSSIIQLQKAVQEEPYLKKELDSIFGFVHYFLRDRDVSVTTPSK